MNTTDTIEVSAATVDEAIKEALDKLGVQEEDVVIEVLAMPRAGVLGLGSRQARVRVTHRPPPAASSGVQSPPPAPPLEPRPDSRRVAARDRAPSAEPVDAHGADEAGEGTRKHADLEEQNREAIAVLTRILELMGEKTEVRLGPPEQSSIELEIRGDGSGILIGRHGQTLDALEYLVNRIVARKVKDAVPIALDSESYRARRRRQLHRTALSKGEEAKREHTLVTLDPMPPRDRRIIHLALKDDPMIVTRSAGDGFLRSVEIAPVDSRRERGEQRGAGERERKPERDQVGQQGGFKHGQKRIV